MNVLVTGSNGQLGLSLMETARWSEHKFVYTSLDSSREDIVPLDITDPDAVGRIIDEHDIDVIVNCAGYTDVDRAECEEEKAFRINAGAVAVLAEAARNAGAVLIHVSTDYVFDGKSSEPYGEDAEPAPLSAYGRSKIAGDLAVLASGCRHIIIRTSWLYSPYGRNFVKTILEKSAESSVLKVVSDQVGTPTYAGDLAEFILTLLDPCNLEKQGIFNYSDEGVGSWYDLAWAVCNLSGSLCEVIPCRTDEYPAKAARPRYSVLDKSKVKSVFGIGIPNWNDSLRYCLGRILEHDVQSPFG